MRYIRLIYVIAALSVLTTSAQAVGETGGSEEHVRVLDNVVAVLDGEPITASELREYRASHGSPVDEPGAGKSGSLDRKLLEDMLLSKMLQQEARELGIAVADVQIDSYVEQIQAQNGVDREGLIELLKSQGLTLEQYREQVRSDILRARVLSVRVSNKINIVDEDVERFLKEHPERVPESDGIYVQQVSFPFEYDSEKSKLTAKSFAESAASELKSGADPRQYGPRRFVDLGYVDPADLRSEFRSALESMGKEEKTALVETPESFYVLLVKARIEDGELSEDFKNQIKSELKDKRFREATEKYITDSLPEKYQVEIKI